MGYVFRAVIHIVCCDPDCGDKGGRGSVRSAVKSGGYCAAKTTLIIKILAARVLHPPLTPASPVRCKQARRLQRVVCAEKAAAMVD